MIKKETSLKILNCYQEIEAAKKILLKIDAERNNHPNPLNLFGLEVANSVLRIHIENIKEELKEANEQAHIEIDYKNEN